MKITPIILSGGSGTRLWPLSRALNPKQFLSFFEKNSLFQDTLLRVSDKNFFHNPIIICNNEHRFIAAEQSKNIAVNCGSIILEPCGRNTAPAIAASAFDVKKNYSDDDVMLVMPSDHVIKDVAGFLKSVKNAAKIIAKNKDYLVTFGIVPSHAETGYGYIKSNGKIVEKFIEKPDKKTAEKFISCGGYFWNSGIFMFRAKTYLSELKRLQNKIFTSCAAAYSQASQDFDFIRLDEKEFEKCDNISIDYAVMEKLSGSNKIAVEALNIGWDDVGNWDAISKNSTQDDNKNSMLGDVIALSSEDCYVNSQSGLVALLGVKNLIIINLKDVTLIADKNSAQDVKKIYEILKEKKREECVSHTAVLRPWGSFETVDIASGFKVKRITVKPFSSLSLQMHYKRAEHWIVVRGEAFVTCGDDEFILHQGESTFIPLGKKHRLENKKNDLLEIIEVQTGEYLGEDDIVRFNDKYGR